MEQPDKLLELYMEGKTSLGEEEFLKEQFGNSLSGEKAWFKYISLRKGITPVNLEHQITLLINKKVSARRRSIRRILSVAASILVIMSLMVFRPWQEAEMDYNEKIAALEEALQMITSNDITEVDAKIIYEDETLIIYTK